MCHERNTVGMEYRDTNGGQFLRGALNQNVSCKKLRADKDVWQGGGTLEKLCFSRPIRYVPWISDWKGYSHTITSMAWPRKMLRGKLEGQKPALWRAGERDSSRRGPWAHGLGRLRGDPSWELSSLQPWAVLEKLAENCKKKNLDSCVLSGIWFIRICRVGYKHLHIGVESNWGDSDATPRWRHPNLDFK